MRATVSKRPTDPEALRVIVALERAGWTRAEVCRHLKISRATYFRRKAELRRIADAAGR